VDHVLAPLPFEHAWFVAQGIPATFVGHPFFDDAGHGTGGGPRPAAAAPPRADDVGPLVLLLPGSRSQEIAANLPSLLRAAAAIRRRVPAARFTVAVLHERHAVTARRMAAHEPGAPVEIVAGRARELMDGAACAVAVSGSVSLELLAARLPAVIVYRISGLAWVVQSWFRHARFITLVNLLATAEPIGAVRPEFLPPRDVPPADPEAVYPEYLAVGDPADRAAGHVVEWLTDGEALGKVRRRVADVAAAIDRPGSADRAAAAVLAIARGGDPAAAVRAAAEGVSPARAA
jgi:lipid-A-disaccharide synthase